MPSTHPPASPPADDVDEDRPVSAIKPLRDRTTEEPVGRWDNRCVFTRHYGSGLEMVCDRRTDHRGMHHGRLFNNIGWGGGTAVIGWVTVAR